MSILACSGGGKQTIVRPHRIWHGDKSGGARETIYSDRKVPGAQPGTDKASDVSSHNWWK